MWIQLTDKKKCPHADANNKRGWVRKTQTLSQRGWRCEWSKQKETRDSVAVQCGQPREFICSRRIFCKNRRRTEISQSLYVKNKTQDFVDLLDVMNSQNDKTSAILPIFSFCESNCNCAWEFRSVIESGSVLKMKMMSSPLPSWNHMRLHMLW